MPKRNILFRWKTAGLLPAIMLIILAGWLAWLAVRDPWHALPRPQRAEVVQIRKVQGNQRTLHYLTLHDPGVGTIRGILSLPEPLPETGPMPLMVVLGGLPTAKDNLRYLPDLGPNAVLVYGWPFQPYLPEDMRELLPRLPHYYRSASRMPGQVAAITQWTRKRPGIDPERVSLLGFSLGALSVPAAQRILEHQGVDIHWTVLAYGGTPISELLIRHPALKDRPPKPALRWLAHLFTRHLDPAEHLPYIGGSFLVMYSREDELVPHQAAERLARLTPEPKTVVVFRGGHMGVRANELELLGRIAQTTRSWLAAHGAINSAGLKERRTGVR